MELSPVGGGVMGYLWAELSLVGGGVMYQLFVVCNNWYYYKVKGHCICCVLSAVLRCHGNS